MSTSPWHIVSEQISIRINELHVNLESCTPDDTRYYQGQIKALRWVLDTPTRTSGDDARKISD